MLVKIVTFFLIGMAVLAMFGRLRWPGVLGNKARNAIPSPRKCRQCGRFNLTGGPCTSCSDKGGDAE